MSGVEAALSAAERSVLVGNVPEDVTKALIKNIFEEVGPVVNIRLVYDEKTCRQKGYAYCEYRDEETALGAIRHLNRFELNGVALRVEHAVIEKRKEESKNDLEASLGGPPVESPYGADVGTDKAAEKISKIMANMPFEELYELMLPMKLCLEKSINQATHKLKENPKLLHAYSSMFHGADFQPPPIGGQVLPTPEKAAPVTVSNAIPLATVMQPNPMTMDPGPSQQEMPLNRPAQLGEQPMEPLGRPNFIAEQRILPTPVPMLQNEVQERRDARPLPDHDLRQITDRRPFPGDKDMRHLGGGDQMPADIRALDPRFWHLPDVRPMEPMGQDMTGMPAPNSLGFPFYWPIQPYVMQPYVMPMHPYSGWPMGQAPRALAGPQMGPKPMKYPRIAAVGSGGASPKPQAPPRSTNPLAAAAAAIAPHDQTKMELIMKVLELTDEQICTLSPEQQESVIVLKEHVARGKFN